MTKTHSIKIKDLRKSLLWAVQEALQGFCTLRTPALLLRHRSLRGTSILGPKSFQLLTDNSLSSCLWKHLTYRAIKKSWLEEHKREKNEVNASFLPRNALKPTQSTRNHNTVHPLTHRFKSPCSVLKCSWCSTGCRGLTPSGKSWQCRAVLHGTGSVSTEKQQIQLTHHCNYFLVLTDERKSRRNISSCSMVCTAWGASSSTKGAGTQTNPAAFPLIAKQKGLRELKRLKFKNQVQINPNHQAD